MTERSRWLLLVEDDPLFARIFSKFWASAYPDIPCRVANSLGSMKEILDSAGVKPGFIVCDRRLPDGFARPEEFSPDIPFVIWSADSGSQVRTKPVGRKELETVIREFRSQLSAESQEGPHSSV